jgi:hypothetical protein
VLLGLGLAVPVFRVHIHIQNKTVVIQTKTNVLEGLPVNACLGIPQTAGVVPDGDAQSIQPSLKKPLWRPGVHISATDVR